MKRILLVCAVIASVFAVQLGTGTASANTQVTPAAQSINGVVGTAITATTAYTVTGISGTKVFVISPTLPAGLSINTATGVVSGTPTASSVASNYTVTVSDGATSATATITIAVSGTATLSPGTQTVTGRVVQPSPQPPHSLQPASAPAISLLPQHFPPALHLALQQACFPAPQLPPKLQPPT